MKLYDVKPNSKIKILNDARVPPAAPHVPAGAILDFKHIDGMYSLCYTEDGQAVHVAAFEDVEVMP